MFAAQLRKLHNVFNPASAVLNIQCALPAATPRLPTLRRVCHSCSAGLPSQRLIKLQFRDRLRIRTHRGRPLIIPGFRCQVCRLVKLQFADCLTASGAISCCAFTSTGGEHAGAIAGAVVGSPTCASVCRTVNGSVIKTIRRTRPVARRRAFAGQILRSGGKLKAQ